VNRVVLDVSTVLALLNREPGAEKLTPAVLRCATIITVTLPRSTSKLVEHKPGANPRVAGNLRTFNCAGLQARTSGRGALLFASGAPA
jgi:PIN domain nuclease of toxin-antitoxin system